LIYLDASALITLVSGRRYANELRRFLADRPGQPMGTSTVGFVETVRTLDRIGDYPTAMPDLVREFTDILMTEDAVHIASAQVIGPTLSALVTYDKRMLEVARSVGLPASAPGLDT
jgi:predicted nucleic acid-binding protein